MRVLIVYAGRTGTCEKAARLLREAFGSGASLRDLRTEKAFPERYDAVVAGSAVRSGQIEPAVRSWLMKNEKALREKKCGIFICNAFMEESASILRNNFPKAFLEECVAVESFGGEIHMEKLGFSDRMKLMSQMKRRRRIAGDSSLIPCLLPDTIRDFAAQMQAEEN